MKYSLELAAGVGIVFGIAVGSVIGPRLAARERPPKPVPARPAASACDDSAKQALETLDDTRRVMAEAVRQIAEARAISRVVTPITAFTEYPLQGERLKAIRMICTRANGTAIFREGKEPFECWSNEPHCEGPDDAGFLGGCIESQRLFKIYQVPAAALGPVQ